MGNQPNARVYAAGAVIAILIIAAIAYAATRRSHGQLVATGASDVASSTATSTIPSITIDPTTGKVIAPPGYTVEEIPNGPVAPNHTKPLTFSAGTSADVKQALEAQFQDDQTRLAKNATDYQAWINLGILRKMTGDYTGAETV